MIVGLSSVGDLLAPGIYMIEGRLGRGAKLDLVKDYLNDRIILRYYMANGDKFERPIITRDAIDANTYKYNFKRDMERIINEAHEQFAVAKFTSADVASPTLRERAVAAATMNRRQGKRRKSPQQPSATVRIHRLLNFSPLERIRL